MLYRAEMFRDSFLPRKTYRWNQHLNRGRQYWLKPFSAALC